MTHIEQPMNHADNPKLTMYEFNTPEPDTSKTDSFAFADLLAPGQDAIVEHMPDVHSAELLWEESEGLNENSEDELSSETPEGDRPASTSAEAEADTASTDHPAIDDQTLRLLGERTGAHFPTSEALVHHIDALHDRLAGLGALEGLISEHADLRTLVEAAAAGQDLALAAQEAFGSFGAAPDPNEDPEGYAAYRERRAEARVREAYEQKRQAAEVERLEQMQRRVDQAFNAFAERNALSEEATEAFEQTFAEVVAGDPVTGRIRPDMFDIVYRGLPEHFDEAMQKAEVRGYNRAVREMKQGRLGRTDGVPMLIGGGADSTRQPADDSPQAALERFLHGDSKANIHNMF